MSEDQRSRYNNATMGDYRIKGKSGIIVLCDRITSNVASFMRRKKKIGERRGKTAPQKAKEKSNRLKKMRRSSVSVVRS